MPPSPSPAHRWKFFRTGGLDQAALENGADLMALDQLDQELWVALSCPVKGLEIDERTLRLIDADADGRIGVPEVVAAVRWAGERLTDPGLLLRGAGELAVAEIADGSGQGGILRRACRQILSGHGKPDASSLTVAEAADTARIFAAHPLNGDGIIPPEAAADARVRELIGDVVACMGGASRISGVKGATAEAIERFFQEAGAYATWSEQGASRDVAVLGDGTDAAFAALVAVRAKIDDFFARSRLARFDPRAEHALNRSEADYAALSSRDLSLSAPEIAAFPICRISSEDRLPLEAGVNPAWAQAMASFRDRVVAPLLGPSVASLTLEQWNDLRGRFAAYEARAGGNPGRNVEKIGLARIKEILASDGRSSLDALVARDRELAPEFQALSDVERLVRYHRDLRTLLFNFVNFSDFYSRDRYAAFQAGTLILDSRSTELCIRVDGPSPLAAMSKLYIAYCACTPAGGGSPQTIAACFTQGDGDYLFVGRNGVFYDRGGKLWYAVVTSILDNPIGIRQAFWSPYKKFLRFIEEQVAKHAAEADVDTPNRLNAAAQQAGGADASKREPRKFDLALVTGIGVAVGSIGTFCAAVFAKFIDLPGWQYPLVLVALVLVISLPSMMIAALKLRQRTLAPILEGNGWAINGRVKINIPFGAALTKVAALPPGSARSLEDPYEDKEARRSRRRAIAVIILLALAAASIWIRLDHCRRGRYFWEPASASSTQAR